MQPLLNSNSATDIPPFIRGDELESREEEKPKRSAIDYLDASGTNLARDNRQHDHQPCAGCRSPILPRAQEAIDKPRGESQIGDDIRLGFPGHRFRSVLAQGK